MNILKMKKPALTERILNDLKASDDLGLLKCVQCGMCTSMCPAARHSDYNPRAMIETVLEEDESIIDDPNIWNCFYCYTCHSICPVGNSACEINQILRQIAIDEGKDKGVDKFAAYGDTFISDGMGSIPDKFFKDLSRDFGEDWVNFKINLKEVRERLGLKPLELTEEATDEIDKILENCGFKDRLKKIRKAHEEEVEQ